MTIVKIPGESPTNYAARVRRTEIAVGNPDPGPSIAELLAVVRAGGQARSLNPCGQDSKGRFDSGNTCAAGDGAPGSPALGPASLDKIFTVAGEKSPYGSAYETPTLPPVVPPEQISALKPWAEVREENLKHFDRLRKRVATLTAKTQEKFRLAILAHDKANEKLAAIVEENTSLQRQHDTISDQFMANAKANGAATPQQAAEFEATASAISAKLMKSRLEIEPAEKDLVETRKAFFKAKKEAAGATAKALGEEAGRVLREDGREEIAKSREREISRFWKSEDRFVGASSKEKYEANPDLRFAIEDGTAFLHEATNPDIHLAALKTSVLYLKNGERAHAVPGVEMGFHSAILMASDYFEVKKSNPNKAAGLWASAAHIALAPGHVSLAPEDAASTYMHEVGHQLEYGNREARELAGEFSKRRTAGEPDVVLKDRFPNLSFKPDEIGRPDDFQKSMDAVYPYLGNERRKMLAHYTGKRYDDISGGATEIVTMGVELMAANAVEFAKADPEYFDLVAGILTGRALGATRAAKIEASKPVSFTTGAQNP